MKNKKYILALFIIVAILSISAVSAADDDSGSMISADDNQDLILEDIQEDVDRDDELIASNEQSKPNLEESNDNVVGESRTVETSSFEAIQTVVNGSNDGDTIYLKNQTYSGSGHDIVVGKSLTFIGNDTVLDANNQSGIFNVSEGVHTITFKNIKFINGKFGTIYSRSINTNLINCTFADNTCDCNYVVINNTDANVNILGCTFENSTSPEAEAFLFILANNTLIDECTFNNIISIWNDDRDRANVKCVSENIILKNSNITNNIRHYFYNTVSLYGKSITVSNCNFDNNAMNSSSYANGVLGLYNNDYGNTKKVWDTLIANVENCSFTNNHPKGHIFYNIEVSITTPKFLQMNYSNVTLRNIVFDNNEGMALYGTFVNETNINNCSFRNMLPDSYNRLIYLMSNKTTVTDSIFENSPHCCIGDHNDNTDLRVYNCTFVNVGQGICLANNYRKNSLTVKDCSFINNTNGSIYGESLIKCIIDNCNFKNNNAENGSAICLENMMSVVENGNVSITNCYFDSNNATLGGAIYICNKAHTHRTIIDNCNFVNNTAEYGGAIRYLSDNTVIKNCHFEKNVGIFSVAGIAGGLVSVYGYGSIYNHNILIDNCDFINNYARGGVCIGGEIINSSIQNCKFLDNYASSKGDNLGSSTIFSITGENSTVLNCTCIGNRVESDYSSALAGLAFGCANGIVANCIFENNSVIRNGSSTYSLGPGVLSINEANATVDNCSFVNNFIGGKGQRIPGGAVYISSNAESNATIKNCNFLNNSIKNDNLTNTNYGGALYAGDFRDLVIIGCNFTNNSVIGGAACGGAIALFNTNNSAIINCIFEDNFATGGNTSREKGFIGGGAICYIEIPIDDYSGPFYPIIANCTFKNNKVSSLYLNFTEEDGIFKLSLEGFEKYLHAIYTCGQGVDDIHITFQNVSYWDGEMLNTDVVAPVASIMASNQPIVFEFYNPKGELVENITRMTGSNGQVTFNYTELTEGFYTYVIYHPDNSYYTYIKGAEGEFNLKTSFTDLKEKIDQATDNLSLKTDYVFNSTLDSELNYGIVIDKNLTIYGNGFSIDGSGVSRIFHVADGVTLTIVNLTLKNATKSAVLNDGDLTIINSTIQDSRSIVSDGHGGAILNNGELTIIDSLLIANRAYEGGAIYNGYNKNATIINSSLINNTVWGGEDIGAAISNYGNLEIWGSALNGNNAYYDGGAIANGGFGNITIVDSVLENNSANKGGAIFNYGANVIIINSTLKNNTASNSNAIWTDKSESIILDNVKLVDQGENPIYAETGEVDDSGVKTLTAVAFAIDDIADFLNGSSITINVAETIKGTEFNGNVTVSIGDNDFIIEVLNGIGSKTVTPNLAYGDYVAKLYFAETDVYDCASAQTNMFHVMNNPQISLSVANIQTGDSFTVKVNTIYTFNGALNVVINGVTYVVDVVNGAGSKTISTNLNLGSYNASIDYAGNENFTADSASTSFTVSKRTTSITASAVTATYSVSKNLVATLKDKTGKAISGVKVTIKLNGKTYTKTTDKNGQVKLDVASLIPKTYIATITFAGNDIYEKSSKNVKVVVKKATPKMTAKAKTFRVKVKVKKYAITLKTNKNKVMKNTKVTLKINKKTFTAKTNKKGVATFKITNLKKKGKFTAVIKYAGSKYYNKLTKKAKITVKK